tara:strand:- start:1953 stop:2210 length:258 start_codon:yes stop_codon:yes gene_type:complete
MKKIESIEIWQNGTTKTATQLQVQGTSVTLGQSASFFWQLLTEEGHQVSQGNLGISGDEYKAWNDDDYIYQIVASDLNLTLVSEE